MKIIADQAKCAGHARCAAVSDFFTLDSAGYIDFAEKDVPAELEGVALKGANACPEGALRLVGDAAKPDV